MKIKFVIVFVIVAYSLISIKNFDVEQIKRAEHTALQYNWAIDAATDDAVILLSNGQSKYGQNGIFINKELAVETFFQSLELSFGIEQVGSVFIDTTDVDSADEFFMDSC